MSDLPHLARGPQRPSASWITQRHALVALLWVVACATGRPGAGASVDFVDGTGREGSLAAFAGQVVVLDVCASWAVACNLNARVLDEVAVALATRGERVVLLTLLLDEGALGQQALRSYGAALGVTHPVLLAGSRVRDGTSVLGRTNAVPRVVVFDRSGTLRVDDTGGVLNVEGLLAQVEPLLR